MLCCSKSEKARAINLSLNANQLRVIVEASFLVALLLAADLSNRTHLLLLIATVSSYSIVVLGLVALGEHLNRGVLRILKAVEMSKD